MGKAEEVWPLLRHSADPRLRSFIVNWLNPLGADPAAVIAELTRIPSLAREASVPNGPRDRGAEPPAVATQKMDAILFHSETSMRRALILALGTYGSERLSPGERQPLDAKLLALYRNDPDAGIHGAVDWVLRKWGQQEKLKAVDAELIKTKSWGDRRWYVNGQGQTFAVIDGPVEFRMGSPANEPGRNAARESYRRTVIPRRFAIAVKEVSIEQWDRFLLTHPHLGLPPSSVNLNSPGPDGPMIGFTWYIAANFSNWLSEQEGLPKDQWCYLPNEAGAYADAMTIPADVLSRTGYRLPTEAEWEYACRAGAVTTRYYGQSIDLLGEYARYQANSGYHSWTCGSLLPNDLGLFDMFGNQFEWCQDPTDVSRPSKKGIYIDNITIFDFVHAGNARLLRGGAFDDQPAVVRSADRNGIAAADRHADNGFRPARTYP